MPSNQLTKLLTKFILIFRLPDFSYDGRIKIVSEYRNEATSFTNVVWTKETVDNLVAQFKSGNLAAGTKASEQQSQFL